MADPYPEGPWLPDGQGLPAEAASLAVESGSRVHLRLTSPGHYPRTACGCGLGELWTGRSAEVTCKACLELVHA